LLLASNQDFGRNSLLGAGFGINLPVPQNTPKTHACQGIPGIALPQLPALHHHRDDLADDLAVDLGRVQ
jgi:hypothetical protein